MGMKPDSVESAPAQEDTSTRKRKSWIQELIPEILFTLLGETASLILVVFGALVTVAGAIVVGTTYGIVYVIIGIITLIVLAVIAWIMSWFS